MGRRSCSSTGKTEGLLDKVSGISHSRVAASADQSTFSNPLMLHATCLDEFDILYSSCGSNTNLLKQVAGVPTNISFLLKLANHREFENGNVETHFIEHYKDDLFLDPSNLEVANTVLGAARFGAKLAAACLVEKENSVFRENLPGKLTVTFFNFM
jgi:hypothetical protein